MHIHYTRLYRIRDAAEHPAASVATIYSMLESGTLAAVMFGAQTGTLCASSAAVVTCEQACAQAACEVLGIGYTHVVVVA